MCERIREKGPLCAFSKEIFLIAHSFWTAVAMSFTCGANIQSLLNTRCKCRAPSTSGTGACIIPGRNRPFYTSLLVFGVLDKRLSNIGFVQ